MHGKHPRDEAKDKVIVSLLPSGAELRIYEPSAGRGELAAELAARGHILTVSSREGGRLEFGNLVADAVDLEGTLPYADACFDVVLCREVIEHIDAAGALLREFHRVLAPGGRLILTFPNRLSLRSRVYHLFTGFFHGLKSPLNLDVPLGEGHINLKTCHEMDYLLRKAGLRLRTVTSSHRPWRMYAFAFLQPLVYAATVYFLLWHKRGAEEHRKDRPQDIAHNREVIRYMTGRHVLYGKDMILRADKDA